MTKENDVTFFKAEATNCNYKGIGWLEFDTEDQALDFVKRHPRHTFRDTGIEVIVKWNIYKIVIHRETGADGAYTVERKTLIHKMISYA